MKKVLQLIELLPFCAAITGLRKIKVAFSTENIYIIKNQSSMTVFKCYVFNMCLVSFSTAEIELPIMFCI